MAPQISQPAAVPALMVGGRVFTDLTNLITLHASAGGSKWSTLRLANSSSGYQVTTGKTLRVHVAVASAPGAAAVEHMIGYGDTDVGMNAAAAPTNPNYLAGYAGIGTLVPAGLNGNRSYTEMVYSVPAGKYPFFFNNGAAGMMIALYCYEV